MLGLEEVELTADDVEHGGASLGRHGVGRGLPLDREPKRPREVLRPRLAFDDVILRAGADGGQRSRVVREAREDDERDGRMLALHSDDAREAAAVREREVEEDDVVLRRREPGEAVVQ